MKILIGTPTGDGTVTIQYLLSVRSLESHFRHTRPAIESGVFFGSASFLPFSRNALASMVLQDKSYTHLLFVDSDMGFSPDAVMRLIRSEKDVVGCLYPKRTINLSRFHHLSRYVGDFEKARNIAHDYAAGEQLEKKVVDAPNGRVNIHAVRDGFIRSLRLGMGLTLIRRTVFETMAERLPEIVVDAGKAANYHAMGLRGRIIQCFSSVSVDKVSLSEDLSFCRRWTEDCGGEVWACVDQPISHVGTTAFVGRLSDRIAFEDEQAMHGSSA